jgi:formylglycine-generating enzyme required for sulfatase activity
MDLSCSKTASPVDVGTARQDVTPAGVHDLGGNVTEWVSTALVQGDRGRAGPDEDPSLPRVLRGGSFYFSLLARTSVRNRRPPGYVGIDVGFRCAADLTID